MTAVVRLKDLSLEKGVYCLEKSLMFRSIIGRPIAYATVEKPTSVVKEAYSLEAHSLVTDNDKKGLLLRFAIIVFDIGHHELC